MSLRTSITVGAGLLVSLFAAPHLWAADDGNGDQPPFQFQDYLVAPLRVHLLSATNAPDVHTTLTEADVQRILSKVNRVWAQAGIHFYLESLASEPARNAERYAQSWRSGPHHSVLRLRPVESRASSLFHVYYLKKMAINGIHFREANFVKDTASLRPVEGGIDEPLPRVTAHELGHALGLPHRQHRTNLMASGTTGIRLNENEIAVARETLEKLGWANTATAIKERADALYRNHEHEEAAEWYRRLQALPLKSKTVTEARERASGNNP